MVRRFVGRVEEAALGVKVLKGVRPDQQLVKVVNDQLIELMGGQQEGLVEVKAGQTQVRGLECERPECFHKNVPPHQQPMLPGGGAGRQDDRWSCLILGLCTQSGYTPERKQINRATLQRASSAFCSSARCRRVAGPPA